MVSTTPEHDQFTESQQQVLSSLNGFACSEQVKSDIFKELTLASIEKQGVQDYLFALDSGQKAVIDCAIKVLAPGALQCIEQILTENLYKHCVEAIRGVKGDCRKVPHYSEFMLLFLHRAQRYVPQKQKTGEVAFITGLKYALLRQGIESAEDLWSCLSAESAALYQKLPLKPQRCSELFGWFLQSVKPAREKRSLSARTDEEVSTLQHGDNAFKLLGVLHQIHAGKESPEALPLITLARNSLRMLSVLPVSCRALLNDHIAKEPRLAQWWKSVVPNEIWPDFDKKTTVYLTASPLFRREIAILLYDILLGCVSRAAGASIEHERARIVSETEASTPVALSKQKADAVAVLNEAKAGLFETLMNQSDVELASEPKVVEEASNSVSSALGLSSVCKIDDLVLDEIKWTLRDKAYSSEQICLLDRFYYCAADFKKGENRPCVDMHYQAILALKGNSLVSDYLEQVKTALDGTCALSEADFTGLFSTHCQNERQLRHFADLLNHLQTHTVFVPWLLQEVWYILPVKSNSYPKEKAAGNIRWRKLLDLWLNELNHNKQDRFDALLVRVYDALGDTGLRDVVMSLIKKNRKPATEKIVAENGDLSHLSLSEFIADPKLDALLTQAVVIALGKLGIARAHHVKSVVGEVFSPVKKASKAEFVQYLQSKPALFQWRKHRKSGECVTLRETGKKHASSGQLAA